MSIHSTTPGPTTNPATTALSGTVLLEFTESPGIVLNAASLFRSSLVTSTGDIFVSASNTFPAGLAVVLPASTVWVLTWNIILSTTGAPVGGCGMSIVQTAGAGVVTGAHTVNYVRNGVVGFTQQSGPTVSPTIAAAGAGFGASGVAGIYLASTAYVSAAGSATLAAGFATAIGDELLYGAVKGCSVTAIRIS